MNRNNFTIIIWLSRDIRVGWHSIFNRWYITDNGTEWKALSVRVKDAQTAIEHACVWYQMNVPNG